MSPGPATTSGASSLRPAVAGALGRLRGRAALAAGGLVLLALLPVEGLPGAALRTAALLGLLALAGALLRWPAAAARPLALLDRQPLGRESGLGLVDVGGRRLLVGFSPGGVALLAELAPGAGLPASGCGPEVRP